MTFFTTARREGFQQNNDYKSLLKIKLGILQKSGFIWERTKEMKRLAMYVGCGIIFGLFLLPADVATATELVWTPINPFFGGFAYNADWLLASATAQNKYTDRQQATNRVGELIQDFQANVQRQVLGRLADRIVSTAFGEEGLQQGHYNLGDFTVDVGADVSGINVVLIETLTGAKTTLQVPYY